MKLKLKVTLILLSMFILTQFIGLTVLTLDPLHIQTDVNGSTELTSNPSLAWIEPSEEITPAIATSQIIVAFVVAFILLFLLTKFDLSYVLKIWFFLVVILALTITFIAFQPKTFKYALLVAVVVATILAFFKIFKRNILVHNLTELFIYPGIAVVFVSILNLWAIIALLILISIYDMWAVWHSGIMQKMAKYQIKKLKVFSGFLVPYMSKALKAKTKKMKKSELRKKGVKVNIAILGGGDIVFPIITAGVVMEFLGLWPAILTIIGATAGISYLFFFGKKKKFYPAMPFITAGMFIGMFLGWILF
jgi:presenilin-like A22 family membrane protease